MFFRKKGKPKKNKENELNCIIISGFAGSGKSTVGKHIAKKLNYTYLDKDTLSRDFTEKVLADNDSYEGDRESELYSKVINPIEYKTLVDTAIENMLLGNNVILSAPFIAQLKEDNWFETNISSLIRGEVKLSIIWIHTDEDTERIRLIDRNATRDKWKLENWNEYCTEIRTYRPKDDSIYLFDNASLSDHSFHKQIEELIQWLHR